MSDCIAAPREAKRVAKPKEPNIPQGSEATGAQPRSTSPAKDSFRQSLDLLARAELSDPFTVLGPHPIHKSQGGGLAIRAFFPNAESIRVVLHAEGETPAAEFPAERIHPAGIYEAILPAPAASRAIPGGYKFAVRKAAGPTREVQDPYNFPPLLTDFDLYLMGEGTHYEKYEKLGAHPREVAGVQGVHFAVWAPNAQRVSVVGDFNQWDGRINAMRPRGQSGVWEIFLPDAAPGSIYKYEIRPRGAAAPILKADPYAVYAELRPRSGSIVYDLSGYEWRDGEWLAARAGRDWLASPVSTYEVHAASWRREVDKSNRWLTYRELADQLIPYMKKLGYTHIELLPIMEYPLDASWGYQTISYFAPTSRFGTPHDFMYFIDRCHQEGLGVLLDWTPAHFPSDDHGLGLFDGTHLYEHADPRQGRHPDWGTLVFNYGRTEVQNFLISNALYWCEKFHMDGLRVDAVASMLYLDYSRKKGEWLPNEFGGRENIAAIAFLKRLNELVHARVPGALMVAEESTAWPGVSRPTSSGGLGFTLKWNLGWMNDTLRYFSEDPINRKFHHNELTFSMLYAFNENFVLPLSHDEVVHGKRSLLHRMPGDDWQKFANLRLLFAYQYAHPGKKLLFMGGEIAQRDEWDFETSLAWHLLEFAPHRGVQQLVGDLNHVYRAEAALHQVDFDWRGFEWLDANDADSSVLSFLRRARDPNDYVIVVANFTPVPRENYRVGVPNPGRFLEILNTDSATYSGTNVGNLGGVNSERIPWLGRDHSIKLRVPPLAVLILKPEKQ
jgi:1,4-alpha-glucan branching enzyme